MFCVVLILEFVLAADDPGIMFRSFIGRSSREYMLFCAMNAAPDSLEVGWFMFGKVTALKSRERIILSLSTRQHIYKNILFRCFTNRKTFTTLYNGRCSPTLINIYLQQLYFVIFSYDSLSWLPMTLELCSVPAFESHSGDACCSDQ